MSLTCRKGRDILPADGLIEPDLVEKIDENETVIIISSCTRHQHGALDLFKIKS